MRSYSLELAAVIANAQEWAEVVAAVFLLGAVIWCVLSSWLRKRKRRRWAGRMATLEQMRVMPPNDFEVLAAAYFEAQGWRVEVVGKKGQPDGGLDLELRRWFRREVVQVKRWASEVDVGTVRSTAGVKLDRRAHGAVVVGLSGFTKPAHKWAQRNAITLIDGQALVDFFNKTRRHK